MLPGKASFHLYCLSHKTLAAGLGIVRVEKEIAQLLRKARWGDMWTRASEKRRDKAGTRLQQSMLGRGSPTRGVACEF